MRRDARECCVGPAGSSGACAKGVQPRACQPGDSRALPEVGFLFFGKPGFTTRLLCTTGSAWEGGRCEWGSTGEAPFSSPWINIRA